MHPYRKLTLLVSLFFLFFTNTLLANEIDSIKFFSSNNTSEINEHTAYTRLIGQEQHVLRESIINIMQKNHIEQGRFEDILGRYQMSRNQNIAADNTEAFITSPYQKLSNQKIFSLAEELANKLHQESVAVFIPTKQPTIGDITVEFISYHPSINEAINIFNKKLPALYSRGFSLYLDKKYSGYDDAKVIKVEWLGSQTKLDEIKKAFPQEKISYRYGKAFIVYANGEKIPL